MSKHATKMALIVNALTFLFSKKKLLLDNGTRKTRQIMDPENNAVMRKNMVVCNFADNVEVYFTTFSKFIRCNLLPWAQKVFACQEVESDGHLRLERTREMSSTASLALILQCNWHTSHDKEKFCYWWILCEFRVILIPFLAFCARWMGQTPIILHIRTHGVQLTEIYTETSCIANIFA